MSKTANSHNAQNDATPEGLLRVLLPAVAAGLLAGCGWVPALVGSLAATDNDKDPPVTEPAAPGPETLARGAGPFLVLDGQPAGIVTGRFLPDAKGDFSDLGAAVIFKEERRAVFYHGDGMGRFAEGGRAVVSGESIVNLAAVPAAPGSPWGLLAVTKNTLEWIQWEGGLSATLIPLEGEADQRRNLTVGDFDGDGRPDVAVSSYLNGWVEFFKVPWSGQPFEPLRPPLVLVGQLPWDVAAGDFFSDAARRSDLAILVEEKGAYKIVVFASRPEERAVFCNTEDAKTDTMPDLTWAFAKEADLPRDERGNLSPNDAADAPVPYDLNGDGGRDLAYIRDDGTGTILVTRPVRDKNLPVDPACLPPCGVVEDTCNWTWKLDIQNRGGGHFSPEAAAIVLLRLPDPDPTFVNRAAYGRATADAFLCAVVVSYFVSNGKDFWATLSYPLPGPGLGLAAGDLDGNGWPDLVALSGEAGRYFLSTFLAEDPGSDPGDLGALTRPFHVPLASTAGETPRNVASPMDVAFGHAGQGEAEPFLTAVDNVNKEVVVWFLEPRGDGQPATASQERYSGLGGRPWGVQVRDFDGVEGDDVCVSAYDRFHLLRSRSAGASPRFSVEEFLFLDLLCQDPAVAQEIENDPDYLKKNFRELKIRNFPTAGPLDGNPIADIVIPFTSKGLNGLLVVRNGFDSGQVTFYALDASPNYVTFANLDGDGAIPEGDAATLDGDRAIDLVVACDEESNGALLILGDPAAPGTFLPATSVLISPIADPLRRFGFEWAATDNAALARGSTPDGWPTARWIAVTTDYYAIVFFNSFDSSSGQPDFTSIPPRIVYVGEDPETILALDLFRSDKLSLDLAIVDENRDAVMLLSWDDEREDWFEEPFPLSARLPQQVVRFDLGGTQQFLAVASRAQQSLEIFERQGVCAGSGDCTWQQIRTFPLPPEDRAGRPAGFSVHKSASGAVTAALTVEDGDPSRGDGTQLLVDLVSLAAPLSDMAGLGSLRSQAATRIPVDNCNNATGLAGVLLADVDRDGTADLLSFEPATMGIQLTRGLEQTTERIIELLEDAPETLVDWSVVAQDPDLAWVVVFTSRRAYLISIAPGGDTNLEWTSGEIHGEVLHAASGWRSSSRNPRTDLFVALMETSSISIILPSAGEVLKIGGASRVGCLGVGDVNGDGLDDLAVVDGIQLRIHLASQAGAGTPFHAEPSRVAALPRFVEPVELGFLEASGDDWTDIACGARDGDVFVFQGNGRGTFGEPAVLIAGPGLEALRATDLDGDGTDEILVAVDAPGLVVLPGVGTTYQKTP